MKFILEGAGIFIYPLGLCSLIAVYIIIERLISLRNSRIVPRALAANIVDRGEISEGNKKTVLGRILYFYNKTNPDPDALKAFAQLELTRLERGMFMLDAVISAAPLLGLLGTVAGLVTVFSTGESIPSPETISKGVGLALSTTIIGLSIAIPAIVGNSYLLRKIDKFSARINICVERLIDIRNQKN